MQVIFDYVDMHVIHDKMHDYFANMQHYKVDTPREFTWQILKDYLLRLKKKTMQYLKSILQTDTDGRTDGQTLNKQTHGRPSDRRIFFK